MGATLGVDDYYSQPWEKSADYFGGANNSHSKYSEIGSTLYFMVP